jgi:hypothetical protein
MEPFVRPYYRTSPNGTQKDFSTKPNVDPYTGKVGTKKAPHQSGWPTAAPTTANPPHLFLEAVLAIPEIYF